MILNKGSVPRLATSAQIRERISFLREHVTTQIAQDQITGLEQTLATIEAFEEHERKAGHKLVIPDRQTWS